MSGKKKYHLQDYPKDQRFLLGILCDEKEYKLSWILNQTLGIKLTRGENISWTHKKLPGIQEFPSYVDMESYNCEIVMISNTSNEGVRLGDYKQFDFLLIFNLPRKDWLDLIRNIKEIRGVYELDPTGLDGLELD